MQQELDFGNLLQRDLILFKRNAAQKVCEDNLTQELDSVPLVLDSSASYIEHWIHRMSFLHYLFLNGRIALTEDRIDFLWSCCFCNALTLGERCALFDWFFIGVSREADLAALSTTTFNFEYFAAKNPSTPPRDSFFSPKIPQSPVSSWFNSTRLLGTHPLFSIDAVNRLLHHISTLSPYSSSWSISAFRCFQRCILRVSDSKNALVHDSFVSPLFFSLSFFFSNYNSV